MTVYLRGRDWAVGAHGGFAWLHVGVLAARGAPVLGPGKLAVVLDA